MNTNIDEGVTSEAGILTKRYKVLQRKTQRTSPAGLWRNPQVILRAQVQNILCHLLQDLKIPKVRKKMDHRAYQKTMGRGIGQLGTSQQHLA
jgi:hypothetical protein